MLCFVCGEDLRTVYKLINHLRKTYLLFEPCIIRCIENECGRIFSKYNSFRKHVISPTVHNGDEQILSISCTANNPTIVDSSIENDDVEFSSDTVLPPEDENGINLAAAHFLLYLSLSSSMTMSNVQYVQESVKQLTSDSVSCIQVAAKKMLMKLGIDFQYPEVQDYFKIINKLKNPFAQIDSLFKLEKHLLTNEHYIKPKEV